MKRKISLPAVAILLVTVPVLAGAVHWVHGYQLRRNARVFLEQADRARDAGESEKEVRHLQTYLALVRDDAEAFVRYALLVDQVAKTGSQKERAFYTIEAALRLAPEHNDLRRRAIDVALAVGRLSDAQHHLRELMKREGETAANLERLGDIEMLRGDYTKAEQFYAHAYNADHHRVSSYMRRAEVLRKRLNRPEEADQCVEAMIQANPENPQAQLARIQYTRSYGTAFTKTEEYRRILANLIERHGDTIPELYLLAANVERDDNRLDAARDLLLRGQKQHPDNTAFSRELARLDLQAGRRAEALATLRTMVDRLAPDSGEYWLTIELLLEAGDQETAEKFVGRIQRNEDTSILTAFFEGRLALAREDWLEALRLLDRVRKERQLPTEWLQSAHLYAARAYQNLNNPDRHLEAAEAALQYDPLWLPGLLSRAEALANLGRFDEALGIYETLIGRWPSARIAAAQVWIARNRRLPEDQRNWDRPMTWLQQAPETVRTSPQALVLQAQLLAVRHQRAEAEKLLEDAVAQKPDAVALWLGLLDIVDDGAKGERVDGVLARAEKAVGDRIEFRLAKAQLAARRGDTMHSQSLLHDAEQAAEKLSGKDQLVWLRNLGNYYLTRGNLEAADRIFTRLTQGTNRHLPDWGTLLDIRIGRDRLAEVEPVLKRLEELEGEDGTLWRMGRVAQILAKDGAPDWNRARQLLAEIRRRRPGWSRPYFLEGQIAQAEGDTETAIELYQAALERGEIRVEVVRRLVELLNSQRQYTEAQNVLARFRNFLRESPDLNRLATLTQFQISRDRDTVVEQIQKSLPETSQDYRDHLLRGQILWSAGKLAEAESALRRALELAPQEPECVLTLVGLLQRSDRAKAQAEIEAAATRLTSPTAPLVLASCYEMVGQMEKAEALYEKAATSRPDDPNVLKAQAVFYLRRGQIQRAEPLFRRLMALTGNVNQANAAWARRTLALVMGATGDYQRYREALKLLDENAVGRRPSAADQRAKALILARQPKERQEAIRNLEAAFARVPPTPEEEFFLATLLVAQRDWPRARERLLRLLGNAETPNPVFLAYFLEQLIQNGELAQAESWIARLESLEPNSLRTAAIKARLYSAQKQPEQALRQLMSIAPSLRNDITQLEALARILDSLDFKREAEVYYRQVADKKDENPRAILPLVRFLGRIGRTGEAIQLCAQVRNKIPDALLAEVAIDVLRGGQPTPEQIRQVTSWMDEAKKKAPGQAIFDLALANIMDLQGQSSQAIRAYRELILRDPSNVLAYNNLAVLLALAEKKPDEALQNINRAIDLAGPLPNLLDTRGIVYLSMQQASQAVSDLEAATQMEPDPSSLFRLAQAYLLARDRRAAQSSWQKAKSAGFQISQMHPLERPAAEKALAELQAAPDRS